MSENLRDAPLEPMDPKLTTCRYCGDEILDDDGDGGGEEMDYGRGCWRCVRWLEHQGGGAR